MENRKKLLLLGGSRYLLPVIEEAHKLGCYVITIDYLPNNIAHKYSDEYVNVSIIDKEAVLAVAMERNIDGIMSFACDPGVVPAAYVAEKMGLPFQGSYDAVCTLQNKNLFRAFLAENGFNCPAAFVFSSSAEALLKSGDIPYPVIVKPTDSAGSKGCTRVDSSDDLAYAVECALEFSLSGTCIAEQFIEKAYPSSDADGFTVEGVFKCISFTSQYFDNDAVNPYAPAAYGMPCSMPKAATEQLMADLQRLSDLLGLRTGVYNIETRVGSDGRPYIMEVTPRGGGNRLCEMLRFASGVDLINAAVRGSLGMPIDDIDMPLLDGFWYQEILHAKTNGVFEGIEYADTFEDNQVRDEQLWIGIGTEVNAFSAANHAFGTVFMRFDTQEGFDNFRLNKDEYMRVLVNPVGGGSLL